MAKITIQNYIFNATASTITLTDFASIKLESILLVTNVTKGIVIYQFNDVTKGGSVANNVLTLTFNTAAQSNTDKLNIVFEDFNAASTSVLQETSNTSLASINTKLPSGLVVDTGRLQVELPVGATRFNEQLMASAQSSMNFKPTWGLSTLRYTVANLGTGAGIATEAGEFRMQTGTSLNSSTQARTNQRGQYEAGSMGRMGIGVRVPVAPTGTQFADWGYNDFINNGFLFGIDATGKYVAYLTDGTLTKSYQSSWNVDKLDGTGPSGLTLNLADGVVSQIDFVWYGYGDIEYSYYPYNPATLKIEKVVVHRTKIIQSLSIIDPNQPLSFRAGNGASSSTNFNVYFGGHQFSVLSGVLEQQQRPVAQLITNFTTAADTNWQPLIGVRKKPLFSGRENSIEMVFSSFEMATDGECEVRITIGGTTSNLTWVNPTGWATTESGAEVKVTTNGTPLTTSADGLPIFYGFVSSVGGKTSGTVSKALQLALGQTTEVILWVRRLSASGSIIVKHANIIWNEEW